MTQHSYTKSSLDYCITKKSREITSNIWKSRKIAAYYVKSLLIAKTFSWIAQKKWTVEHEYVLTALKYVIRNQKIKMNHTKSHSITPFFKRNFEKSLDQSIAATFMKNRTQHYYYTKTHDIKTNNTKSYTTQTKSHQVTWNMKILQYCTNHSNSREIAPYTKQHKTTTWNPHNIIKISKNHTNITKVTPFTQI